MYKSPIEIIQTEIKTQFEDDCLKAVQSCGFIVNKEELIKALTYDRKQYDKGYSDGHSDGHSGGYNKGYSDGYSDGYNKAIDDFADKMNVKCDGMIKDKWNSNTAPISWAEAYADFKDDIDEIAEELRQGY